MRAFVAAAVCGLLGLAGCAGGVVGGSATEGLQQTVAGATLTGVVHGGQNPISGAQVYLYAAASGAGGAGMAAYGGNGIAASTSNASVSLLTSGWGQDASNNWYVKTGSDGSFSISGDYTCTAGQQVYLYSIGGDPGLGTGVNAAAGLMAVLGTCPAGGNFLSGPTPVTYVVVNEVSTVAAAYAMAGFATDTTHVGSSGTALALTGIANAFANAANRETLGTGVALAKTPAGNGTVPQAEINTLANILAACVNSNGAVTNGTPCSSLEVATETLPFDTAKAAINLVHYPSHDVSMLYAITSSTPPFAPALTAQPNDWTISIAYTGGGLSSPNSFAIDGAGNIWVLNETSGTGSELSNSGAWNSFPAFAGQAFLAIDPSDNVWIACGSGLDDLNGSFFPGIPGSPAGIAIDGSGNVWMPTSGNVSTPNQGRIGISEFTNTGTLLGWISGSVFNVTLPQNFGVAAPQNIAIDSSGNAWVPSYLSATVSVVSSVANGGAGQTISPGGGLSYPNGIAIDGSGNVWIVSRSSIVKLSNSGTLLSGASGYGDLLSPQGIAIDGRGYAWITNMATFGPSGANNNLVEMTNTGVGALNVPGLLDLSSSTSVGPVAIDGSGNVWMILSTTNTVLEVVGAAVPVVTPLSVGAKNNMLGTRP